LTDASWKDACKLDSNKGVFEGLIDNIKDYGKAWKKWYDEE